ncbi:MAG: AMP-binding protein [Deltaproteobacteria bacterium]|nr:AMP-binding protein [Deltaproteobacteria bacterium]
MNEALAANLMRRIAFGDSLRRTTRRYRTKEALVCGEQRLTYEQLNEKANRFANALLDMNLAKGSVVAFTSLNCLEFFIALCGTAKAGMIFLPLNPFFKTEEMTFSVNNAEAAVFIFDGLLHSLFTESLTKFETVRHVIAFNRPSEEFEDFHSILEKGSPEEPEVIIDDNDVLLMLYTGGTTRFPRAAQLTHLNIFCVVSSVLIDLPATCHDTSIAVLPLFHVAACAYSLMGLFVGSTIVIQPQLDMKLIMETIEREKVTQIVLLPPLYRQMLDHPDFGKYDLSSLRMATYIAAVMPEDLLREIMEKICPNLSLMFGQTEMSPSVSVFKPEDQLTKMKSLGNSTVHVEIAVMDDDGNLLPPGEIGEFVYRAPTMTKGYYKNGEENEKAFKYGWFHSGDVGYLDKDNYVYFVDRKKDMIKTGGENVASIEVEKTIYLDTRVQEVHVLGLPHERWIEAITAFVTPKPGETITEEEILSLCKSKMVGFKVPKKVVFLDEMPRSAVGKVLKYKIKEAYSDLYAGER